MRKTLTRWLLPAMAALAVVNLTPTARAAEPPKPEVLPDLDKLVGQPADLAPWAYAWRADRTVQEKPEAYFIPRRLARLDTIYRPDVPRPRGAGWRGTELGIKTRLPAPKGALHSALLWETRVPFTRIELHWPADGRPIPPAEAVEVRIYSGHHWWWGLQADWTLAAPQVSPDQRTWTYAAEFAAGNPDEGRAALRVGRPEQGVLRTDLISVFVDPKAAPDGKAWSVPAMQVFGPLTWKRMDVEIEWGFQPDATARDYSGRIEGYFGQAGQVAALPDDAATKVTGGTAWQSSAAGGKRRGVTVPLLYFPGLGASSTLSSKMTVWSKGGSFTFLPANVAHGDRDGPVLRRQEHADRHRSPRYGPGASKRHEQQPQPLRKQQGETDERQHQGNANRDYSPHPTIPLEVSPGDSAGGTHCGMVVISSCGRSRAASGRQGFLPFNRTPDWRVR